jgi:hypothetical protein
MDPRQKEEKSKGGRIDMSKLLQAYWKFQNGTLTDADTLKLHQSQYRVLDKWLEAHYEAPEAVVIAISERMCTLDKLIDELTAGMFQKSK